MNFAILWGAGVALISLGMLITGSASINEGWIAGAATMVFGLFVLSSNLLVETGWFETREIAMGVFFVFFVAVAVLATIMSAVQLVRWARDGEGAGEVRRRALMAALVLVFQTGFLLFVGIMFATL